MLLKLKLATTGFVPDTMDVDLLNTYFETDPAEEEGSESETNEEELENEELIPDEDNQIHRIDEEARRLDEIYYGIR
jgi:hypothetical protein